MSALTRQNGRLHLEAVALEAVADQFGTPSYVYSRAALEAAYDEFALPWQQVPNTICYAVKACSNLSVLKILADRGAGFDIVSGGELERVMRAGGRADRIFFSGVGKQPHEMAAALKAGIACFNVESKAELETLADVAAGLGLKAPISLRVNPEVDPRTHPYIATGLRESKFGIAMEEAMPLYQWAAGQDSLDIVGLDCHIGSQITELDPFTEAFEL